MFIAIVGYQEHISRKLLADEPLYMVKCYICENLYHRSCVNVTINSKEMCFCKHKGCKKSFGYLFDSQIWINVVIIIIQLMFVMLNVY